MFSRNRCRLLRVAFSTVAILLCSGAHAQNPESSTSTLKVMISTNTHTVRIKDVLSVRVDIANQGNAPMYIPTKLELGGPCGANFGLALHLFFADGKPANPAVRGCGGSLICPIGDARPPLSEIFPRLSRVWLVLEPGRSYGGEVIFYPPLNVKPGKYLLKGSYWGNRLADPFECYQNEIAQLPVKPWTGNVDTNSIPIKVLKPAKSSDQK